VRKIQARVKTQICVIRLSYCNAKTQKTQICVTGRQSVKVFNHLPQTIKNLERSPVKFKNDLKNFFHRHPFYSIKEYFEQGNPTRG
jgi:hypothetical protein